MILLLGDIHGNWTILEKALGYAHEVGATALIQVGDFGLFPGNEKSFYMTTEYSQVPVYFIDGNHDDCTRWTQYTTVTQLWDGANLWYIPRGTVMDLDERTVAFMGGAASIDKGMREMYGWHWDEKENINSDEINCLITNANGKKIDLLITHCPPNSVIEKHFDPKNKLRFGVGLDWTDPNQQIIENIWVDLGKPNIYSGHMHKKIVGENYRILDINELLAM